MTHLGDAATVGLTAPAAGALLTWRRRIHDAVMLVATVAAAGIGSAAIRLIVERQRPHVFQWLVPEGGYSFPSGHPTGSMALALATVVIVRNHRHGRIIGALVIALAVAVGLSRLFVGVHYPTDIAAGWLLAAAAAVTVTITYLTGAAQVATSRRFLDAERHTVRPSGSDPIRKRLANGASTQRHEPIRRPQAS